MYFDEMLVFCQKDKVLFVKFILVCVGGCIPAYAFNAKLITFWCPFGVYLQLGAGAIGGNSFKG